MSAGDRDDLTPGAADVRDRFAADFLGTLWERPDVRKRWILRQRNEASVREVADSLAWSVAVSLDHILPTNILGPTIRSPTRDRAGLHLGPPPRRTDLTPLPVSGRLPHT
ncbi:hypothetical protein [Streptomyces sp. NPDC005167]